MVLKVLNSRVRFNKQVSYFVWSRWTQINFELSTFSRMNAPVDEGSGAAGDGTALHVSNLFLVPPDQQPW